MRIVIDLQACQTGSRLGGIGRYSMALVRAMLQSSRGHEFYVVLNGLYPETIEPIRNALINLLPPDRIKVIRFVGPVAEAGSENHLRYKVAELMREYHIREIEPDAIFIASLFEGLYEQAVTSIGLLTDADRTAAILYDLIPLVDRDKYLSQDFAYNWYRSKTGYLEKAGLALSISQYSKQEGHELLALPDQKVVNMSSAIDDKFAPMKISDSEKRSLKEKMGIRQEFLMFTGSFDQRKNHEFLIKAFAGLPEALRSRFQLVMVGNGWDGAYNHLHSIGESVGLSRSDLVFTGHTSDLELLQLYNLCTLFVFPSLREGFGLPVLEAMACGAPAIGSNVTSIPEVIGCEEALFDPSRIESIRDKIAECLSDAKLLARLKTHSLQQAAKFSWHRSAAVALDEMERRFDRQKNRAKGQRRGSNRAPLADLADAIVALDGYADVRHSELEQFSQAVAINEASLEAFRCISEAKNSSMRVGWVTTWNTRCGIATYTIPVSGAMPADQWVFAPRQDHLVEDDDERVVRCWNIGGDDDLTELAEAIEAKGIDTLIVQFNYGFFDMPSISKFLKAQSDAGRVVFIILHATKDPDPLILNRRLAEIKEGLESSTVFVHQAGDVANLAALGLSDNVRRIPLGMHEDAAESMDLPVLRAKTVVGTYGFALPNKGLIELIESFAAVAAKQPDLHLLMVNAEFSVPESRALLNEMQRHIEKLGLEGRVTIISDYLTNGESIGYLRLCDLIVIPYQRTTESSSGSARMALAAGRPVAVTPLHIFDDLDESVFRLPGMSVEDMASGIEKCLDLIGAGDPAVDRVIGQAKLWVEAHGFGAVGRYLFTAAMEQAEVNQAPHFA